MQIDKSTINRWLKQVPEQLKTRTAVIGGCVRDALLREQLNDIDFVVENSNNEEMLSLNFKQVGKDFPVYLKNGHEFALCRQERKSGDKHTDFKTNTENVTFEEDQKRRDLTINSILVDYKGKIQDPFNGIQDLKDKILRHTSIAFIEDPLRVLRLARFTAKFTDFGIHEDTKELCISIKNDLQYITKERVFKELEKALNSEKPSNFFRTLLELEALEIVFPEIYEMTKFNHNPRHHAEGNVFEHTMRVLDQTCLKTKDPIARFAALFHDIGKIRTFAPNLTFHGHTDEELNERLFMELKEKYKFPNKYINFALKVAINHQKVYDIKKFSKKGIYNLIYSKHFPKTIEEFFMFMVVIQSDSEGRIQSNAETPRTLTQEEADLVFKYDNYCFEDFDYFMSREKIENEYLRELFFLSKQKLLLDFTNKTVNQIRNLIYKERYANIIEVMTKYEDS